MRSFSVLDVLAAVEQPLCCEMLRSNFLAPWPGKWWVRQKNTKHVRMCLKLMLWHKSGALTLSLRAGMYWRVKWEYIRKNLLQHNFQKLSNAFSRDESQCFAVKADLCGMAGPQHPAACLYFQNKPILLFFIFIISIFYIFVCIYFLLSFCSYFIVILRTCFLCQCFYLRILKLSMCTECVKLASTLYWGNLP